ncbi:MAG: TlpA family protein disulfide reductase [Gammaproteobacteria bacterium]|nr:TlpA family protein disulfide reductase [Gammaproteobacteria bacterium]MDH5651573.1 TlpA family protein disulfide reductase [Gammaproteobacteria bacterium]
MLKAVHAAPDNLKVGQTAPDFRISSLQRDYFSLTELRAEGQVLLYFWSTRCHVCDSLLTKINALQVRYQNRQMTVVGVNIGYESHAEVRKYLNNNNFGFLVLNDDTQKNELREKYRIQATPLFVLVSRRGKIEYLGHAVPDLEQFIPSLNLGAVNP